MTLEEPHHYITVEVICHWGQQLVDSFQSVMCSSILNEQYPMGTGAVPITQQRQSSCQVLIVCVYEYLSARNTLLSSP
jgi:hypothetical protein